MLKNIGFDGFSVKTSSFNVNDITEQGTFNVSFSEIHVGIVEADKEGPQQVIMTFDVTMIGHAEGVDAGDHNIKPAFDAKFVIETVFVDLNERPMSEEDIHENFWFFENFNQIATKIASDNIFKNSDISHMPIPWTGKNAVLAD